MKVLIGQFNTESNANIPYKNRITDYDVCFGAKVAEKMQVKEVFEEEGVEVIPAIYAVAGAGGVLYKETFEYIEACMLKAVRTHKNEIDGIYLMLHGASEVEEIGSGDHHILKEIRKIVGPYLPIFVSCDPHGNLCKEYVEYTTLIRSYRESPHTDQHYTWKWVARQLCYFLKNRQNIHSVYRKLPLILGGEQSVSADEPVKSINKYMDELEKDPRILSCSWHVGYIRHDSPVAGCGIVVVPASENDQKYAEEIADKLAKYVWDKRHEFHYTGITAKPEEAIEMAINAEHKPAVITDSGDNTTSGATGWNTYVLRQFLDKKDYHGSVLFAPISDLKTCQLLSQYNVGDIVNVDLGVNHDEMSKSINIDVEIINKGDVCKFVNGEIDCVKGSSVIVKIKNTNIIIMINSNGHPIIVNEQLEQLGINWTDFDIIVLKQGYIFPNFKEKAGFYVMSLTNGATPQDTAMIPFKLIQRPMYPIDNI